MGDCQSYSHEQIPAALCQAKAILLSTPALQKQKNLQCSSSSEGTAGIMTNDKLQRSLDLSQVLQTGQERCPFVRS